MLCFWSSEAFEDKFGFPDKERGQEQLCLGPRNLFQQLITTQWRTATLSVCVLGLGGADNADCDLGQKLHLGIGPTERVRSLSFESTDGANSAVQFLPQIFYRGNLVSSFHHTLI